MRFFGLALVAMAIGAFTVNSVNAQDEVLVTIGKTATAPEIDGLGTDAVWESVAPQTLDDFFELPGDDPAEGDEDFQVSWKALYDDTNLYVYVEVGDDEIVNEDNCNWQDDSIEIYLDAQNLDVEDYRPDAAPGARTASGSGSARPLGRRRPALHRGAVRCLCLGHSVGGGPAHHTGLCWTAYRAAAAFRLCDLPLRTHRFLDPPLLARQIIVPRLHLVCNRCWCR